MECKFRNNNHHDRIIDFGISNNPYARVILSRSWQKMNTRWRKIPHSALVVYTSGHIEPFVRASEAIVWPLVDFSGSGSNFLMPPSHCPEVYIRWTHDEGNLNFARRWPRTWSTANQQPKQVRCIQKVTWWHPNHTRRQHEYVNL